MLFEELVEKIKWEQITTRLIELYPDMKENQKKFAQVLDVLKSLSKQIPTEDVSLLIEKSPIEDKDGTTYDSHDVLGYDSNNDSYYGIAFMPWEKWLGMEIASQRLQNYDLIDILIHALWEMTFYGFTQDDINKARIELDKPLEDDDYEIFTLQNGVEIRVPAHIFKDNEKEVLEFIEQLDILDVDQEELIEKIKQRKI